MSQLLYSFLAFLAGVSFTLARPHLYKYILIAIIVNILSLLLVFSGAAVSYYFLITKILTKFNLDLPLALDFSLGLAGLIMAGAIVIILFGTISGIANSLVYGELTDAVLDEILVPDQRQKIRHLQPIADLTSSLSFELKKLLLSLLLLCLSILISLIPIIGLALASFLSLLTLIIFNGLDAYEPALTRANYNFRHKISYIFSNPLLNIPFALIAGSLNSITLLNIFTIPFSVVGAALLYKQATK